MKYSRFENFAGNPETVPTVPVDKPMDPLADKKGIYALFAILGLTAYFWTRK